MVKPKLLYLRTAVIDYPRTYLRLPSNEQVQTILPSLRHTGLLMPIMVRKKRTRYEVISGVLRLKAWKRLGKRRIRCRLVDPKTSQVVEVQFQMNATTQLTRRIP